MINSNLNSDLKLMFIAICNTFKENAWKTKCYSNGTECFGGRYFVAGVRSEDKVYTHVFPMEYWDSFKCEEIDRVPNLTEENEFRI